MIGSGPTTPLKMVKKKKRSLVNSQGELRPLNGNFQFQAQQKIKLPIKSKAKVPAIAIKPTTPSQGSEMPTPGLKKYGSKGMMSVHQTEYGATGRQSISIGRAADQSFESSRVSQMNPLQKKQTIRNFVERQQTRIKEK